MPVGVVSVAACDDERDAVEAARDAGAETASGVADGDEKSSEHTTRASYAQMQSQLQTKERAHDFEPRSLAMRSRCRESRRANDRLRRTMTISCSNAEREMKQYF